MTFPLSRRAAVLAQLGFSLSCLGQALPNGFPQPRVTAGGVRLGAWQKPAEPTPAARALTTAVRQKLPAGPLVWLPAPDLDAVHAEDARAQADHAKSAQRISIRRPLPAALNPRNGKGAGRWNPLPDGSQVWTGEVGSEGAVGLRLHFASVQLPAGTELLVFASDRPEESVGPYAAGTLAGREDFWSGTVFAARVTVECRVPAGVPATAVSFRVDELLHRYVAAPAAAAAKSAAGCNLDITCEPAWLASSRAVAGLGTVQATGELFCTACLLNDTDPAVGTDFVMTANHCVGSQAEADDTEFYWFYQSDDCNGTAPALSTRPRTAGGADFIAGSDKELANDFAFLRLRQPTPAGVVYAAWSSEPMESGMAVTGIHHPSGDYKRISFGELMAFDPDYWQIEWARGITEPGSSGSPLFNPAQEFVGQLFGGTSSCDNLMGRDIYGRFDRTFPLIDGWLLGHPVLPANDRFARAAPLTGLSGSLVGSSAGAGREATEPKHAGNVGGKSVWYRWTSPATTGMTFTTSGSEFDTLLAVYTGDTLAALTPVAANNEGPEFPLSLLSFPAVAGTTYFIAVDGQDGAGGRVGLEWHPGSEPGDGQNDNFSTAQAIAGGRGETGTNNRGATKEPGEPDHAGNPGGASIWFRWTAPVDGEVSFDTEGSDIDTVIAIYGGDSLANLSLVAENDDIDTDLEIYTSRASFEAVAGTTYFIAVDGFHEEGGTAEQGFILLTWQPPEAGAGPAPANDDFAAATGLPGNTGTQRGNDLMATKEPGEPEHAGTPGGKSVWFDWTAVTTGLVTFDSFGSNFDTVLAVYSGDSVSGLALLGENDDVDRSTRQSRVTVPAVAGNVYRVAVDGFETESGLHREGEVQLAWSFATGGGNDSFANAQPLTGLAGQVAGENRQATREPGEPRHAGGRGGASIWYRWTAPEAGETTVDTVGTSFDTVLGVYTGSGVDALVEVAHGDDISQAREIYASRAAFAAVKGQEYRLAVDGYRRDGAGAPAVETGSVVLNWRLAATVALRLTETALGATGFSAKVTGTPGGRVVLQSSPDLKSWAAIATATLDAAGQAQLADPAAATATATATYYRAIRE